MVRCAQRELEVGLVKGQNLLTMQEESGLECKQSDLVDRGRMIIAVPSNGADCVFYNIEIFTLIQWSKEPIE